MRPRRRVAQITRAQPSDRGLAIESLGSPMTRVMDRERALCLLCLLGLGCPVPESDAEDAPDSESTGAPSSASTSGDDSSQQTTAQNEGSTATTSSGSDDAGGETSLEATGTDAADESTTGEPAPGVESSTGACTPASDAELCARAAAECGALTVTDACGDERTLECGQCTDPDTCGGTGEPNQCGCEPETDQALCDAANGCEMGVFTDQCGNEREVDCGVCAIDVSPVCTDGECVCDVPPEITNLQCQSNGDNLDFTFTGATESYFYTIGVDVPPSCNFGLPVLLDGNVGFNDVDIIAGIPFPGECRWFLVCAAHDACEENMSPGVPIFVCTTATGNIIC